MNFTDRFLKCADCGQDFVFTAGEQLFFFDKQFKNDPKRCKLCKAKRAGLGRVAGPNGAVALPLSRTETRTRCSSCDEETTVPFKPTQGRPVLCRACFEQKRVTPAVAAAAALDSPGEEIAREAERLEKRLAEPGTEPSAEGDVQFALRTTALRTELLSRAYEQETDPLLLCCSAEIH